MAETFFCRGEQVHFTNDGCHELYVTWSKCASRLGHNELSKALDLRANIGRGFAADGIDNEFLSEEFQDRQVKCKWLEVMGLLINDIYKHGEISEGMDVNWDQELREYWLRKLSILRSTLNEQVNV
jgi:hypothetical protein